jgi:hypothetical protein
MLRKIREKIHDRQYVVTTHADEEADDDSLTVYDIEHVVLTGEITERQRDPETNEWKYRILGRTLEDEQAVVVAKIGPIGKLVIITVFRCKDETQADDV